MNNNYIEYRNQKLTSYISDYLLIHKYLTEIPKKDLKKIAETYLKLYQQQKYNQVIFNIDPQDRSKAIFVSSSKELFKLNGQLLSIAYITMQQEQEWSILIDILKLFSICIKEEYYPNPIFVNILVLLKYLASIDYDLTKIKFDPNSPLTLSAVYLPIKMNTTSSNNYSVVSTIIDDPFVLFLIKSVKNFIKLIPSKQKIILDSTPEFIENHISEDQKYLNITSKELKEIFAKNNINIKNINIPLVVKKDILSPKLITTMEKKTKKANKKLISQLWILYKVNETSITIKPVYYYKDIFVELFIFRLYNKFIYPLKLPIKEVTSR